MVRSQQKELKGMAINLKKGTATQEAFEKIKRLIYLNQLSPNQKLIYADLAKKLNMGVTPIIQALNKLESDNLLKYVPNKGYYVGELDEDEAGQLYQAREALELSAMRSVIQNIDSQKLNEIRQCFGKKEGAEKSRRELILEDTNFHLAIIKHAHNDVIYKLLERIFEQIYLKYPPEHLADSFLKQVFIEHRELLRACEESNLKKTIALTRNHVRAGLKYIISSMQLEKSRF